MSRDARSLFGIPHASARTLRRPFVARGLAAIGLLLGSAVVHASPILSLDADPSSPGIQSALTVGVGDAFAVDVVVSGIEADAALNAFAFDLDFDSFIVTATIFVDGGFLRTPVIPLQIVLGPSSIGLTQTSVIPTGAVGEGVLATVTFEARSPGLSLLDLGEIALSTPLGVPIPVMLENINDATISVVVPEPQTVFLFSLAMLLIPRLTGLGGRSGVRSVTQIPGLWLLRRPSKGDGIG